MTIPEEIKYVFDPITIGDITLKNRIMLAPMAMGMCDKGFVTDRMVDYYAERAKGLPGLLCVEMAIVDYPIGATSGMIMMSADDDKFSPGLKRIADVINAVEGVHPIIELSHGGRYCHSGLTGIQPVAPSAIPGSIPGLSEMPRELTTEEVDELVNKFGDAAVRCNQAGYAGVLLMGSTGYLISQFSSPIINKRTDKYGGKTPAERATFICEIIKNIRKKLGKQFPIIYKISSEDYMPGGLVIEDTMVIAKRAEVAGADVIHAWAGFHESPKPMLPMSVTRGAFVHLAEAMKTIINVPVMTGGRINDIRFANDIIRDGRADLVHMGRAFLSDAHFITKALDGDFEDMRLCIGCVRCFDCAARGKPINCAINAEMGFEKSKLGKTENPKSVLIIGGGPAGMETARVASGIRGHTVTLWEKNAGLGGNLSLSSIAPHKEEMRTYYDYLINQMNRHEVNVVLNKNATADEVIALNPNVVVIATGASIDIPNIPGIDKKNVVNGIDVLKGKSETGDSVVVLGGGMIGCEVSEFLASKGKNVSMVEMEKKIARDVGPAMKWDVVRRIKRWGINLLLSSKAVEIADEGVIIEDKVGTKTINADTVVYALGMLSNSDLYNKLDGKIPNLYQIGDCVKPAQLLEAVHAGYNINRRF